MGAEIQIAEIGIGGGRVAIDQATVGQGERCVNRTGSFGGARRITAENAGQAAAAKIVLVIIILGHDEVNDAFRLVKIKNMPKGSRRAGRRAQPYVTSRYRCVIAANTALFKQSLSIEQDIGYFFLLRPPNPLPRAKASQTARRRKILPRRAWLNQKPCSAISKAK